MIDRIKSWLSGRPTMDETIESRRIDAVLRQSEGTRQNAITVTQRALREMQRIDKLIADAEMTDRELRGHRT